MRAARNGNPTGTCEASASAPVPPPARRTQLHLQDCAAAEVIMGAVYTAPHAAESFGWHVLQLLTIDDVTTVGQQRFPRKLIDRIEALNGTRRTRRTTGRR